MQNRKNRAMPMIRSSVAYSEIENVVKMMQCIESAHKIFSEFGLFKRVTYCFVEYALLLKSNQQYSEAIAYFNIALKSLGIINTSEDLIVKFIEICAGQ